ncbi:MAG: large-conductance mechanosensitive channel protein MscL [Chloroflexi bacterium]|nr:large-conductance mechanosensitive channel protein MscL [Chloroflexota bacterium]
MLAEFRKFIMRGNVLDLAVGIIIGAAFTTVVNSLVNDVIMPPIGVVVGGVDFSQIKIILQAAQGETPEVAINIGLFINAAINFLIVALVVFLIVRAFNRMMQPFQKKEETPGEPVNKECPYCLSVIPYKATRCPNCTSQLEPQKVS